MFSKWWGRRGNSRKKYRNNHDRGGKGVIRLGLQQPQLTNTLLLGLQQNSFCNCATAVGLPESISASSTRAIASFQQTETVRNKQQVTERFDLLPRDPSGLGLDTRSRSRTSSASSVLAYTMKDCPTCSSSEEQKESLINRWPQRRNSRSLSARTPFPLTAVTYTVIRGLAGTDEQVGVLKGRTEKRTDRLLEGREREDRRSESKRQRRHNRVKNERIRAVEENKMYI
ncbi:hypothetical protein M9H77_17910 [Catharanthus roseus]|uniref:Uncharacterized protein n=1 Tax=Catharanthus roseus TaxID=4058 RepID=A0ACC0B5Y2_CATRO|nr:hypothetical protein M9H77_17910 [Catharanthus roseus]